MDTYVEWSRIKDVTAICDETGDVLILEYRKFNTLYSEDVNREFWFNNALTPYAYVGLCIFLCRDTESSILDKYEIIQITQLEEED